MRISRNGLNFLKKHEGCVLYAYQNYLKKSSKWDVPTIGYGYTVGVKMGKWHLNSNGTRRCSDSTKITQQQAEDTLMLKIANYENVVRRYFKGYVLTQGMYDALCSLAWNCGSFNSSLVAAIKKDPYSKVTQTLFWNHRIGAADVLKRRRREEWALFVSGGPAERISGPVSGRPTNGGGRDERATFTGTYQGDTSYGEAGSSSNTQRSGGYTIEIPDGDYTNNDENAWDGGEVIQEVAFEGYATDDEDEYEEQEQTETQTTEEEANEDPTKAALDKLINSQCGSISIPGLDPDTILQKLAEKSPQIKSVLGTSQKLLDEIAIKKDLIKAKYDENNDDDNTVMQNLLATLDSEIDTVKKEMEETVKRFIEDNRQIVMTKINVIKMSYKSIKEGVDELMSTVTSSATSIALPAHIGAGTPNPAKSVAEFVTIKHQLKSQLSPIMSNAITLLTAAQDIMFSIPSPITTAIDAIATVQKAIDAIPG